MKNAHGGKIIERILDSGRSQEARAQSGKLPSIKLSLEKMQEVLNITTGVFNPLMGNIF